MNFLADSGGKEARRQYAGRLLEIRGDMDRRKILAARYLATRLVAFAPKYRAAD